MHGEAYSNGAKAKPKTESDRQKQKLLQDVKMSEREVEHAIKVTEGKLETLKKVVLEKKGLEGGENAAEEREKEA